MVQEPRDCTDCLENTAQQFAWYATADKIAEEIDLLKSTQCALDVNPSSCEGAVDTYWPGMAMVLFTNADIVNEICIETADCPAYKYELTHDKLAFAILFFLQGD